MWNYVVKATIDHTYLELADMNLIYGNQTKKGLKKNRHKIYREYKSSIYTVNFDFSSSPPLLQMRLSYLVSLCMASTRGFFLCLQKIAFSEFSGPRLYSFAS